jgi:hypothetical protein
MGIFCLTEMLIRLKMAVISLMIHALGLPDAASRPYLRLNGSSGPGGYYLLRSRRSLKNGHLVSSRKLLHHRQVDRGRFRTRHNRRRSTRQRRRRGGWPVANVGPVRKILSSFIEVLPTSTQAKAYSRFRAQCYKTFSVRNLRIFVIS